MTLAIYVGTRRAKTCVLFVPLDSVVVVVDDDVRRKQTHQHISIWFGRRFDVALADELCYAFG